MKKDPEYRERAYKAVFFGEKNAEEDPVKTMGQKQYQARDSGTADVEKAAAEIPPFPHRVGQIPVCRRFLQLLR